MAPTTIPCPHCAEQIMKAAKVCRHCGRDVAKKGGLSKGVIGCLARLALMGAGWTLMPDLPRPSQRPGTSPSAPGSAPPAPAIGSQWQLQTSRSPVDDSQTVVLVVEADTAITGWPGKIHKPTLILRCQQNKTEVYVNTGFAPDVESGNLDGATVSVHFDKEEAKRYNTSKSTDGEALFFPNAISLAKTMMGSSEMLFHFVPFNSDPQHTTFQLTGLSERITPLQEACKWK